MSDPEIVAIHEAAHVVVAHLLGFEVAAVSIRAADGVDGFVDALLPPLPDAPKLLSALADRQSAENMLLGVLAGLAAEMRWSWGWIADIDLGVSDSADDTAEARALARRLVAAPDVPAALARAWRRLADMIDRSPDDAVWSAIEAVAAALLERQTMGGDEAVRILGEAVRAKVANHSPGTC
jgi:hypothetical protein